MYESTRIGLNVHRGGQRLAALASLFWQPEFVAAAKPVLTSPVRTVVGAVLARPPPAHWHLDQRTNVPNNKQQEKRMRLAARQRLRNRQVKSSLKTLFKKFDTSVAEGDRDTALQLSTQLASQIDKAASKGVIHKNAAARRKSLVARHLGKLS